jgi:acyl carrier protein
MKAIMGSTAISTKLQEIFSDSLSLKPDEVVDDLRYAEVPQWDSVAHMALIAAIEEGFDIMIDAEDVINMSSFSKAKEIVARYLE